MIFDNELIKDIIVEKEPDIKRESIVLYDIYDIDNNGGYIIANYCIIIIKNIHGMEKDFTYCKNLTIKQSDYEIRLKEKIRDDKLDELGI